MIVRFISLLGRRVMWLMGSVSRIVRIMGQLHVAEEDDEVEVAVDSVVTVFFSPTRVKNVMSEG